MNNSKHKKYNLKISFILIIFFTLFMLAGSIVSIVMMAQANSSINIKITKEKENKRPANMNITIITDKTCTECFSLDSLLEELKQQNIKIQNTITLDSTDDRAIKLIEKYNIEKLPALLVSGELDKTDALQALWSKIGQVIDDVFILRQTGAPYIDTKTNKIRGIIFVKLIDDKSCSDCYEVKNHLSVLSNLGLAINNSLILDISSSKGRALINRYNIRLVPALIITGDISAYPAFENIWKQVGTVERDGAYVFREGVNFMGKYKNLITNKVITPQVNQN